MMKEYSKILKDTYMAREISIFYGDVLTANKKLEDVFEKMKSSYSDYKIFLKDATSVKKLRASYPRFARKICNETYDSLEDLIEDLNPFKYKIYTNVVEDISKNEMSKEINIVKVNIESPRDLYVKEEIFLEGDMIFHKNTKMIGTILHRGSNHLFVEFDDCKKKIWISDAKPLSESNETFKPPVGAANNAKKALKWRDEHGDEVKAGTRVGWTRANQLADRENLSYETVKRMAAFERHRKNSKINPKYKDTPWKDNGYVAWLIWGGDSGIKWAKDIVNKKEKKNNV